MSAKTYQKSTRPRLGEVAVTDAPIDAPLTREELAWWEAERGKVFWKHFGWRMFGTGGFAALASFTRGLAEEGGGFDVDAALFTLGFSLAAAGAISALLVRQEVASERDRLIRRRRVQAAIEAEGSPLGEERP